VHAIFGSYNKWKQEKILMTEEAFSRQTAKRCYSIYPIVLL